jgi:hypothetical protein
VAVIRDNRPLEERRTTEKEQAIPHALSYCTRRMLYLGDKTTKDRLSPRWLDDTF